MTSLVFSTTSLMCSEHAIQNMMVEVKTRFCTARRNLSRPAGSEPHTQRIFNHMRHRLLLPCRGGIGDLALALLA